MTYKYRLIKDLPCHEKGTVFRHRRDYDYTLGRYRVIKTLVPEDRLTPTIVVPVKKVKDFDSWFERIEKDKDTK